MNVICIYIIFVANDTCLFNARLAELDELEQAVKNGTHPEYLRLLKEIENKREKRIRVTKAQYELALQNQNAVLDTIRKASKDNLVVKHLFLFSCWQGL